MSYESEALRVQAIIARTYIRRQMEASGTFQSEAAVGETGVSQPEQPRQRVYPGRNRSGKLRNPLWIWITWSRNSCGVSGAPVNFPNITRSWSRREIHGRMALTYEGSLIDPMFFRLSAGMTREGDFLHPYFQNVDCPEDMEADGFVETQKPFPGMRRLRL